MSQHGRRPGDERGSMPLAMLLMVVGAGLAALLSTTTVAQVRTTGRVEGRVHALDAALAGFDVAVSRIRASADGDGGDRRLLPCGVPISGLVDGSSWYDVSVDYYLVDPSTYRSDPAALVDFRVGCEPDGGTTTVPRYALLRSRGGTGGDADGDGRVDPGVRPERSLYATYTFTTVEGKLPGGVIRPWGSSGVCVGASTSPPRPDTAVVLVSCTRPTERTRLVYPRDLTLLLSETRTAARPTGLCLSAARQAAGVPLLLKPCDGADDRQRWALNADSFAYHGTSDGVSASGFCLSVASFAPGVAVELADSCDGKSGGRFVPASAVGPGAAGPDLGNLVNYGEVGRCLDVTDTDVTGGRTLSREPGEPLALITYPCKQAFDGRPLWNHRWTLPRPAAGDWLASGQIITVPETEPEIGVQYCMRSPGPAGGFVWLVRCSTDPDLQWSVSTDAPFARTAYQVTDRYGNCLEALGPAATARERRNEWSKVVTRPCVDSEMQKWNKPGEETGGPLKDLGER